MDIYHCNNEAHFVATAVKQIIEAMNGFQAGGENITVGLSGGKTPRPVYGELGKSPEVDWQRVTFFLVDERYVSAQSEASNRKMIEATLLRGPAQAAKRILPDTSLPLEKCIEDYTASLKNMTPDIVILGLGGDGHIASLFPPLTLDAEGATVIHTVTDKFEVRDRISVTLPLLKHAKRRFFLISGKTKYELLEKMRKIPADIINYPAQELFDERTTWIVM
ncbi:6-phosphogluconolactonase [Candidatus Peribacteria bacterium RIFCSPHIGHO2_02_FULL_51_15]|nr:MAG: 6-phosphogluconolactonase [Candidatus Peribacteria bacterium RIFCSPHIGHO2_02_FULL_51_15]